MRKGSKMTEASRQKMSLARTGKKQSEAHTAAIRAGKNTPEGKARASAAQMGNTKRRGKKASEATRKRISEGHKGLVMPEKQKQLLSEIMRSESVNAQISESVKRAYANPEFRERQRQGTIEAVSKPEYQEKMSESVRRAQATDTYKANHKEAMANPELREKLRNVHLGIPLTEEHKQKIKEGGSERAFTRWANVPEEERREHMQKAILASQQVGISSLEVQVKTLLDALGVSYEQQYRIGRYLVDFYIASENLVVEVNGCWWHSCPQCGYTYEPKQQSDERRLASIRKKGYKVVVIWEHDMQSDLASILDSLAKGET